MPFTLDEAAFASWHWANGVSQKEIGRWFGHTSGFVSLEISKFILEYVNPPHDHWNRIYVSGNERKVLALQACQEYCRKGQKLRIRIRPGGLIKRDDQGRAGRTVG